MRLESARGLTPLVAVVLLAAIVLPTSSASAAAQKTSGATAKKMAKQIKLLKQRTTDLTAKFTALQATIADLEANQPTASSVIDSAGGVLTGAYPNPQLRAGTITGTAIADATIFGRNIATETISGAHVIDGTIGGADITDGSIAREDLSGGSVGGPQLGGAFIVQSGPNPVGGNNTGGNQASCPAGTRLLSGGVFWEGSADNRLTILRSAPDNDAPNATWEVGGLNKTGTTHGLVAKALCLG